MPFALKIANAPKPLLYGAEFWWSQMLDLTADGQSFSYADLDGRSAPYHEQYMGLFLVKMERAGFIERAGEDDARVYRMVKRQRNCPVIGKNGKESKVGLGQQNMWNVMRRRRGGFTVQDLMIEASTDEVQLARNTAKQYCMRLERAGLLVKQKAGKRGEGRNIYVLRGSANTGPKPPRKYSATLLIDQNTHCVIGDVTAEEDDQ